MNDFTYNVWFIYNEHDGNGRKILKYIQKQKTKEKSPVWLPSHPPVYKILGICLLRQLQQNRLRFLSQLNIYSKTKPNESMSSVFWLVMVIVGNQSH